MSLFRMLPRGASVRHLTVILSLITVAAAAWLYMILRIKNPLNEEFISEEDKSKLTHHDNTLHSGFQSNERKLLTGTLLNTDTAQNVHAVTAGEANTLSAEDMSKDAHITTRINSVQKKIKINETKSVDGNSVTAMGANNTNESQSTPIYPLFKSADEQDFPTIEGHVPRIPHIIHQIYEDEMVPAKYINHVKSFLKYNPKWEYKFWTDESGRRLLQKYHPYLVQVYDNFGKSVMRSDLLRYAVLYEYGGFYADLDMDNLRSLNRTTMKYACIVPVEPFEHSALLENAIFLMNNAIMGCRPKHPFFKLLLSDLRTAKSGEDPVGSTGPRYVTRKFIQYNRIRPLDANRTKTDWSSNSPYFYKGELKEDDNDAVYVPNSQYFMDNLDPIHVTEDGKFTKLCSNTVTLPYLSKRACSEFYRRRDIREEKKYTFTVHHWYHLWLKKKSAVYNLQKVNIKDVVQNFISYYG